MQNRSPRRWLPGQAKKGRRLKRLSNLDFTYTLKSLNLKYVMVIAGSCYSRTLKRSPTVGLSNANNLHSAFRASARVTMVPGGLEPIADYGGDGNSPFAWPFVRALSDDLKLIDGEYKWTC